MTTTGKQRHFPELHRVTGKKNEMDHGVTIFEFILVTIDVDSDDERINDHDNEWTA